MEAILTEVTGRFQEYIANSMDKLMLQVMNGAWDATWRQAEEAKGRDIQISDDSIVEQRARNLAREITAELDDSTTAGIRRAVANLMHRGWEASLIGAILIAAVGLNSRQVEAMLDLLAFTRANPGKGYRLSGLEFNGKPKNLEAFVKKYGRVALDYRGDMTGAWGSISGANAGQIAAWTYAREIGELDESVKMIWVVVGESCILCENLEDQVVDINLGFLTDDGDRIPGPPLHVFCDCFASLYLEKFDVLQIWRQAA